MVVFLEFASLSPTFQCTSPSWMTIFLTILNQCLLIVTILWTNLSAFIWAFLFMWSLWFFSVKTYILRKHFSSVASCLIQYSVMSHILTFTNIFTVLNHVFLELYLCKSLIVLIVFEFTLKVYTVWKVMLCLLLSLLSDLL